MGAQIYLSSPDDSGSLRPLLRMRGLFRAAPERIVSEVERKRVPEWPYGAEAWCLEVGFNSGIGPRPGVHGVEPKKWR